MRRLSLPLLLTALAVGCAPKSTPPTPVTPKASLQPPVDDLAGLSDEFTDPESRRNWRHVGSVEKWPAEQLRSFEIGEPVADHLVMIPRTSTWYKDYRGVLAFKMVEGDFVATTKVKVRGQKGEGAPQSQFSLAGIMVRTPRDVTPATWKPGGENYVFLSLGAADRAGAYQFEVKTTTNSDSQLRTFPAGVSEALLRVVRVGPALILMTDAGKGWQVQQRYSRTDMPNALQVGLTTYTDWPTASKLTPEEHNKRTILDGNPDLVATFDYIRFNRPQAPESLKGLPLDNPASVSDQQLVAAFGG